jgi:tetratricopeptide (TPR) repeat protein
MLAAALLIVKISQPHPRGLLALVFLFAFTRVAQATPWSFWADPVAVLSPDQVATFHQPPRPLDRVLRTTQVQFVRSLGRPNRGVIASVSDYLNANAAPRDIVITNYAWEALYFHTSLPQGAKISTSFPIYRVARARGLPEYVFGADKVRWIVWRRAWPAYFAEQDIPRLLRELRDAGVTTELIASFPETLFENRENVHFRRYPGGVYVFPWFDPLPDVQIYRVDWESDVEASRQRAEQLFSQDRFDEAAALYRMYLESRPTDWDAWTQLGIASAGAGDLEAAIAAFRHVVGARPQDGGARRNLATALYDSRKTDEALAEAQRAAALWPDDPDTHDLLGRALAVNGKLEDAAVEFERALRIDPAHAEARRHLASVIELQRR